MSKVIVGMSGGVDSAVTAYLLKIAGYDVIGVTLKIWTAANGEESRCCEITDAQAVAAQLDIPYYAVNCMSDFKKHVTDPFVEDYLCGITPSPCVGCNRKIKWSKMLEVADSMGAEYIATGHYAHIVKKENGRLAVKTADYASKDQTYMLYRLSQEQLARTLMPLGKLSKEEVRDIARKVGLKVAEKHDSMELCFIPDGNYADYIEEYAGDRVPPEGNFVSESGEILGRHKGIIHYTIGQRKGLGIAFGHPMFVKEIRPETNEVVLSEEEALFTKEVFCNDLNFQSIEDIKIGEKLECKAKVRYRHNAQKAVIERIDSDKVKITFEEPVRAATPGQSAVFYDEEGCAIGGGVIVK